MKIADMFGQGRVVFSCEVFPPKKSSPVNSIFETLDGLREIQPDFISVTFGAGGDHGQVHHTTREIASIIENQYHITAMAHMTCVAASRSEVDVTQYLEMENGRIKRGVWHEIEIVPDKLTRIEANLFVQLFVQSRGGGDF